MVPTELEQQSLALHSESFASFPKGDGPTEGHHFDHKLYDAHITNFPEIARPRELIFLPRTDSTMNAPARFEAFEARSSTGTVFLAGEQTNGTGQDGRWFSGLSDVMMTMSVLRIPDSNLRALFRFAVGVAVADTLKSQCPELPELAVKWPNDVFTRAGWQKVSGILNVSVDDTEQFANLSSKGYTLSKENLLVGVGINLGPRNKDWVNIRGKPVSVEQLTDKRLHRESVVAELACRINQAHREVTRTPLIVTSRISDYLLTGNGHIAYLDTIDNQTYSGIITNTLSDGIHLADGRSLDTVFRYREIRRIYPDPDIRTN